MSRPTAPPAPPRAAEHAAWHAPRGVSPERPQPLRSRMQRWWEGRHPRTDTLLLTQRNVYILPTPAGWMFGLTLLVLLLASVNYQLSLGYGLTFLLAGSAVVSMHLTHATLRGLTLHLRPVAATHAGSPAVLEVVLTSPGAARFGIGLRVLGSGDAPPIWLDVPALGQAHARLQPVLAVRGQVPLPALGAQTRFPLGLFRAWTVWRPAARVWVYPRTEQPPAALPLARPAEGGASALPRTERGELDGVRAYRRGDPMPLIAWKKTAQAWMTGAEWVSRDTHAATARQSLWLDWQACGALAPEDRLSRLTAWVLAADRAGLDHGLRLPGLEFAPAGGPAHRRQCLEALALWR